jgi:hypothetical protein
VGRSIRVSGEQWRYFEEARRHVGGTVTGGLTLYLIGQAAGWALVLLTKLLPDDPYRRAAG